MKENNKTIFTIIYQGCRAKMGLNQLQYGVADCIDKLASGKSRYPGWCYADKEYLATVLGVTEPTIYKALKDLKKKGIIEQSKSYKKLLRTTCYWKKILSEKNKINLFDSKTNFSPPPESSLDNSNRIVPSETNTDFPNGKLNSIKEEGDSDFTSEVILNYVDIYKYYYSCEPRISQSDREAIEFSGKAMTSEEVIDIFMDRVKDPGLSLDEALSISKALEFRKIAHDRCTIGPRSFRVTGGSL